LTNFIANDKISEKFTEIFKILTKKHKIIIPSRRDERVWLLAENNGGMVYELV